MSPTSPNITLHACHSSGTQDCSMVGVFGRTILLAPSERFCIRNPC
jgi:hypothetical protein